MQKQVRQGSRSLANVPSDLEQVRHYLECISYQLTKRTYNLFIQESCKVESVKVMPKAVSYSGYDGRNGPAKVIQIQFCLVEVAYTYT